MMQLAHWLLIFFSGDSPVCRQGLNLYLKASRNICLEKWLVSGSPGLVASTANYTFGAVAVLFCVFSCAICWCRNWISSRIGGFVSPTLENCTVKVLVLYVDFIILPEVSQIVVLTVVVLILSKSLPFIINFRVQSLGASETVFTYHNWNSRRQ